jgi:hypothetical protein
MNRDSWIHSSYSQTNSGPQQNATTSAYYQNIEFVATPEYVQSGSSYSDPQAPHINPMPAISFRNMSSVDRAPTLEQSPRLVMDDSIENLASELKTVNEKLTYVLESIAYVGWTLGECMYHLFATPKDRAEARSPRIATTVSRFVAGTTRYTVADIVGLWLSSPDGKPKPGAPERDLMYSVDTPFKDIKAACPAFVTKPLCAPDI